MEPCCQIPNGNLIRNGNFQLLAALPFHFQTAHFGIFFFLPGHNRFPAALGAALCQLLLLNANITVPHFALGQIIIFFIITFHFHLSGAGAHIYRSGTPLFWLIGCRCFPAVILLRGLGSLGTLLVIAWTLLAVLLALALLSVVVPLLAIPFILALTLGTATVILIPVVLAVIVILVIPVSLSPAFFLLAAAVILAGLALLAILIVPLLAVLSIPLLIITFRIILPFLLRTGLLGRLLLSGLLALLRGRIFGRLARTIPGSCAFCEICFKIFHLVLFGIVVKDHTELLFI